MTEYLCNLCNYSTKLRPNYERHLTTKKHIFTEKTACNPNVNQKEYKCNPFVNQSNPSESHVISAKEYVCKYCDRIFKYRQSVSKHIKYSCKKNTDEDLKELVRLLNLQLQQKDQELEYEKKQKEQQQKRNEKQQKQIEKLMDKLQVPHVANALDHASNGNIANGNHNQSNANQNNIKGLCPFKPGELALRGSGTPVPEKYMIDRVHFNPDKPENQNIYISNRKDKYIMVYESNNWNIKNKQDELNTLYENNEMLLEDWLEEYGTEALREKYRKYLSNKEDPETFKQIKENIHMMMYNKRPRGAPPCDVLSEAVVPV